MQDLRELRYFHTNNSYNQFVMLLSIIFLDSRNENCEISISEYPIFSRHSMLRSEPSRGSEISVERLGTRLQGSCSADVVKPRAIDSKELQAR
jgi:hypothetical protein